MENKVVDGLRCCIEHGTLGGKSCRGYYVWSSDHSNIIKEDAHEDECPYKNCETGCVVTLARDALSMLSETPLRCGNCTWYDDGKCTMPHKNVDVKPDDYCSMGAWTAVSE